VCAAETQQQRRRRLIRGVKEDTKRQKKEKRTKIEKKCDNKITTTKTSSRYDVTNIIPHARIILVATHHPSLFVS